LLGDFARAERIPKATDRRRTARADDIDAAAFRPEFCCAMLRED
jgi:hypothetical protein